ncbi:MAG: cation:proton antiporter [Myxococcota bacterium]
MIDTVERHEIKDAPLASEYHSDNHSGSEGLGLVWSLVLYATILGVFLGAVFAILHAGGALQLASAITSRVAPASVPHASKTLLLLAQIGTIIAMSRAIGWVFGRLGQPQVVGEMLAGILLGPSLFGWLMPTASAALFPSSSLGALDGVSQVGLALFMFTVGMDLNLDLIMKRPQVALLTSHVSIFLPFVLGMLVSLLLYESLAGPNVPFLQFSLFMGISMSITAFPVLARILAERGMLGGTIGTMTLACAAIDDVTAWCVLASVITLARAGRSNLPLVVTVGGAIAFGAVMIMGARPGLAALSRRYARDELGENALAAIFILLLASASLTEWLGIHALFGAFVMGAIVPRKGASIRRLQEKVTDVTVVFFLPTFFALTGLRTDLNLLNGGDLWLCLLFIIGLATLGKFGGSMVSARIGGLNWRDASVLGILMNTRGLMELVALNIGYDAGIISKPLFAMMVCMALFTTALTTPVLAWLTPGSRSAPNPLHG